MSLSNDVLNDLICYAIDTINNNGNKPSYEEIKIAIFDALKLHDIVYSHFEENDERHLIIHLNDGRKIKIEDSILS
jgi:hypothetical protein